MGRAFLKKSDGEEEARPRSVNERLSMVAQHHRGEEISAITNPRHVDAHLVSLLNPASVEAERYRRLRHAVENMCNKSDGIVVGLTSPVAGDGKTITSINLAGALAQDPYARVLLIELDLRQPFIRVKDYLGINNLSGPGVVDRVLNKVRWENAIHYVPDFNLYVMPSGRQSTSPYEVLKSPYLGELLEEARRNYDFVVVDTAPVALMPDSQLISEWVDGFLVVVAADKTPRQMLAEALNYMDPNKVMGLVFNGHSPVGGKYSGYEYAYSRLNAANSEKGGMLARMLGKLSISCRR